MRLDVDNLLGALEQPVVLLNGVEHQLKYPSFIDRLKMQQMYDEQDWTEDEGQEAVVRFVCGSVGLEDADELLALPETVLTEVMSFLLLMSRGIDMTTLPSTEQSESLELDQ